MVESSSFLWLVHWDGRRWQDRCTGACLCATAANQAGWGPIGERERERELGAAIASNEIRCDTDNITNQSLLIDIDCISVAVLNPVRLSLSPRNCHGHAIMVASFKQPSTVPTRGSDACNCMQLEQYYFFNIFQQIKLALGWIVFTYIYMHIFIVYFALAHLDTSTKYHGVMSYTQNFPYSTCIVHIWWAMNSGFSRDCSSQP